MSKPWSNMHISGRERSEAKKARVREVIAEMEMRSEPVTVTAVARNAGVARSFVYSPDLHPLVVAAEMRHSQRSARGATALSNAGLTSELEFTKSRLADAKSEIERLKSALNQAVGDKLTVLKKSNGFDGRDQLLRRIDSYAADLDRTSLRLRLAEEALSREKETNLALRERLQFKLHREPSPPRADPP